MQMLSSSLLIPAVVATSGILTPGVAATLLGTALVAPGVLLGTTLIAPGVLRLLVPRHLHQSAADLEEVLHAGQPQDHRTRCPRAEPVSN